MRVLITGGAGYVGTALLENLALRSDIDEIIIYDNLSRGNYNLFLNKQLKSDGNVTFVQGDILDTRSLKAALNTVDTVFHLAARVISPYANLDPHIYEQVNHWGTAEVVSAVEESAVDKLIYLSSTSVYGDTVGLGSEQTVPRPRTFYGTSKLRGEKHVNRLVKKGRATIIRAGNVYGFSPSMRFDAVLNRFAFEANFSKRISIQGSGMQSRAFIHVDALSRVLADLASSNVPTEMRMW